MPDHANTYMKGLSGEKTAEDFLFQHGMTCIERRYRSPHGEIDLIVLDGDILAFVEVKSRQNGTLLSAQLAVTPLKQRKIIQTALCYLNEYPEYQSKMIRFDIVSVAGDCIHHQKNAFYGSGW